MKKRTIRVIAVALCLAMCLGLTACGASLGAMLTVRKCLKALSDASNVSFTYQADGEAEIAGEDAADGRGHDDWKTLGRGEGVEGDTEVHVARDKRVGGKFPRNGVRAPRGEGRRQQEDCQYPFHRLRLSFF